MAKNNPVEVLEKTNEATSKIEAIKNLIFGENIAEYNSEFEALKKDLKEKREELEGFIEDTKKELHIAIDSLSTDLNIRITELEDTLTEKTEKLVKNKVDKKVLSDLLINLGEKISQK